MPEIMNVTNSTPGYDTAVGNRSIPNTVNDPNVQNIPNPARVTRPDANTGEQQSASEGQTGPLRYDSNFQAFLQRLQSSGDTVSELARLLSGDSRMVVSSGLRTGTAEELSRVLEMLEMSEGEFLQFLKDQAASGSRFSGPLLDLLRSVYQNAGSGTGPPPGISRRCCCYALIRPSGPCPAAGAAGRRSFSPCCKTAWPRETGRET